MPQYTIYISKNKISSTSSNVPPLLKEENVIKEIRIGQTKKETSKSLSASSIGLRNELKRITPDSNVLTSIVANQMPISSMTSRTLKRSSI